MCGPADDTYAIAFVDQWVDPTCMVGCPKPLARASVYEACNEARTLVASGCMHPCMFAPAAERTLTNELLEICNLGTQFPPPSLFSLSLGTTHSTPCLGREGLTEHKHGPMHRRAHRCVEKSTGRGPAARRKQRRARLGHRGTGIAGSVPSNATGRYPMMILGARPSVCTRWFLFLSVTRAQFSTGSAETLTVTYDSGYRLESFTQIACQTALAAGEAHV